LTSDTAECIVLRSVIIVTGTPGAGKTALSKRLASEIGAKYLSLSQLISEYRLARRYDKRRGSRIVNVTRARSKIISMVSTGGLTIVDTHLPEGIVPREMTRRVLVLRCHPGTLKRRLVARGWKVNKIRENVLAELLDVCLITSVEHYGKRRVVQLDTSRVSLTSSVRKAKQAITHPLTITSCKIDWITTLEKEGALERYLK
jgi:adenylate kinase